MYSALVSEHSAATKNFYCGKYVLFNYRILQQNHAVPIHTLLHNYLYNIASTQTQVLYHHHAPTLVIQR